MFPKEYVNFGKITWTDCEVSLYSDNCHRKSLCNVPYGIERAYWQGDNVHVELKSGWHYIYQDFNVYHSWM